MFNILLITGGTLYMSSVVYKGLNQGKIGQWREKAVQFFSQTADQTHENSGVKEETSGTKQQLPTLEIEHRLVLSSLSLGFATAGSLFQPALAIGSVPVLAYLGLPAGKEAYKSLRQEGRASLALLDTIVLAVCLVQGYYIAGSLLFSFDYLSRIYLKKCQTKAFGRLSDVIELPTVPELQTGQMIVIEAGEMVPADGIISDGIVLIDEYQLTGNHSALIKQAYLEEGGSGDKLFAGTIVLAGRISMQIENIGDRTYAAQLSHIRQQAAEDKTELQVRSEKLAQQLVLPLLYLGSAASFMLRPLSILGIMATRVAYDRIAPLGKTAFLADAARHGILIQDGRALEALSQVKMVLIEQQVMEQPESLSVIRALREHNLTMMLFTSKHQAKKFATIEEIEHSFTEELPEHKASVIEQLQAEGERVCYIAYTIAEPIQKAAHITISLQSEASPELKPPLNALAGNKLTVCDTTRQIILLDGTLNQLAALFEMAQSFSKQSQTAFMMSITPAIIAISGPFLFHSGLLTTIVLNQIGLLAGAEYAMKPQNHQIAYREDSCLS